MLRANNSLAKMIRFGMVVRVISYQKITLIIQIPRNQKHQDNSRYTGKIIAFVFESQICGFGFHSCVSFTMRWFSYTHFALHGIVCSGLMFMFLFSFYIIAFRWTLSHIRCAISFLPVRSSVYECVCVCWLLCGYTPVAVVALKWRRRKWRKTTENSALNSRSGLLVATDVVYWKWICRSVDYASSRITVKKIGEHANIFNFVFLQTYYVTAAGNF